MVRLILGILFFTMVSSHPVHAGWKEDREKFQEVFEIEEFRIFYTLTGKDAIPPAKQVDDNENNVPDYVEDLGEKLVEAHQVFQSEVDLVSPLESERYSSKVEYVDVHLFQFPLKPNGPKHGVAYDGISTFQRSGVAGASVLVLDISNDLSPGNRTPGHELFHLYQNGYTMFKNRWYTEGTARWAENLLSGRLGGTDPLPTSAEDVKKLFSNSYGAAGFWRRVIEIVDSSSMGKRFMKAFLEELEETDDTYAEDFGLELYSWKESIQKSPKNNPYIWKALVRVLKRPKFKGSWNQKIKQMVGINV